MEPNHGQLVLKCEKALYRPQLDQDAMKQDRATLVVANAKVHPPSKMAACDNDCYRSLVGCNLLLNWPEREVPLTME